MSRLELSTDLRLIESNGRLIRSFIDPDVKMLAVVKADAYGHGSVQVAQTLEKASLADYFAVATAEEGAIIRKAGIKTDILVLGYSDEQEMELALSQNLHVTVYSEKSLLTLMKIAEKTSRTARAHLKIETGMNRIGIEPNESLYTLLETWKKTDIVEMTGIFSHFSSADSDIVYTDKQFSAFINACEIVYGYGFTPIRHISASSAMLNKRYQLDMVRAGIALYGVGNGLLRGKVKPAQTLRSHPVRISRIKQGDKVGYSQNFTAQRDTTVVTIPCGYADGYPRILSNRAFVLANGKRLPLIGNICMDMMMADATDAGEISMDTEIILMGEQCSEKITAEDLSVMADTIPYEIMLGFSGRVERKWNK